MNNRKGMKEMAPKRAVIFMLFMSFMVV